MNEGDWKQVPLGQNGREFLSILLQPAFPKKRVDEQMWNLLTHDASLSSCTSHRYSRDKRRRWKGRHAGGESGGDIGASLGGRQHIEDVRAKVAGLVLRTIYTRKKSMVA